MYELQFIISRRYYHTCGSPLAPPAEGLELFYPLALVDFDAVCISIFPIFGIRKF